MVIAVTSPRVSKLPLGERRPAVEEGASESQPDVLVDRSIGQLIGELRNLSESQIELIVGHQRKNGVRFGEAAIELQFASKDDVLWALSQQFHYPYALEGDAVALSAELVVAKDPFSAQAETFRDVRSQLLMGVLAPELPRRALAILSTDIGEGKTYFASNLALAFSQLGGRTLLVDADMRAPRLHRLFNIKGKFGLSNILAGRAETDVIHQIPKLSNLYLLPVGTIPPNPLELFQRPALTLLLRELCAKFDHVIVDTAAANRGADARVCAAKCGAALVVARRGSSRMHELKALIGHVTRGSTRFAGVIINDN